LSPSNPRITNVNNLLCKLKNVATSKDIGFSKNDLITVEHLSINKTYDLKQSNISINLLGVG
jgi:hypothetical protein